MTRRCRAPPFRVPTWINRGGLTHNDAPAPMTGRMGGARRQTTPSALGRTHTGYVHP